MADVPLPDNLISMSHGPFKPSLYDEGENYCVRCHTRSIYLASRQCNPHIDADQLHAYAAAVSAEKDAEIAGLRAELLKSLADNAPLRERVKVLEDALLRVARTAEALKKDCGMDPESPQAVRNGQYMNISYAARAALAARKGTTPTTPPPSPSPRS